MEKMNKVILSTLSLFIANGCSSPRLEKELSQKISQESSIQTPSDLAAESDRVLKNNTSLSVFQKQQLLELKNQTRALSAEQNSESLKLRSVLIKDLLAKNYNESEVYLIKNKIKKVESKKIDILLSAVQKANVILGQESNKEEIFMRDVYQLNDY